MVGEAADEDSYLSLAVSLGFCGQVVCVDGQLRLGLGVAVGLIRQVVGACNHRIMCWERLSVDCSTGYRSESVVPSITFRLSEGWCLQCVIEWCGKFWMGFE